ncbi:hypothetical protein HN51_043300 [Arachis hypogaea]
MSDLRKSFQTIGLKGSFKLGLLDQRHVLINLDLEEDYSFVPSPGYGKRGYKRVDESLFESIIGPPLAGLRKSPGLWKNRIRESGRRLVTRYIPDLPRMALEMTLTWDPTWKSVPSLPRVKVKVRRKLSAADQKRLRKVSAFHCIEDELNAWFRLAHTSVSGISDWVCLSCIGVFGSERPEAIVPSFLGQGIDLTSKTMTKVEDVAYGRLAQVIEGGGKRRIFAIGNYLSQRLLHPFWVMDVLRTIPMDGTFNQDKPLLRLVPAFQCFSYD